MGLYADKEAKRLTGGLTMGGTMPSGGSSYLTILGPNGKGEQWGFALLINKTAADNDTAATFPAYSDYTHGELIDDLKDAIPLFNAAGAADLFEVYSHSRA